MIRMAGVGSSVVVMCVILAGPAQAQLRGEARAVAAVDRMLEALGGAELWAEATTLELVYRGLSRTTEGDVVERAWRDLARPEQRIEVERPGMNRFAFVLSDEGSWFVRGDSVERRSESGTRLSRLFWQKDFYTLLRRLAEADPDLWVETFDEDGRVVVYSETMGELGWWEIAADGGVVRWGTTDEGESLAYVYGPMRSYGGGVRFPAWGASLDGGWRFEYEVVELSDQPLPREMLNPTGR